jgi:hypothetical protein
MNAGGFKHNLMPTPTNEHQILLRAWIELDGVQKNLGEYFDREKVGVVVDPEVGSEKIEARIHGKLFRDVTRIDPGVRRW